MSQILDWYRNQTPANRKKLVLFAIALIILLGYFLSESNQSQNIMTSTESVSVETIPFSGKIFIHVVGSVVTPGLYELKYGARVSDAIAAAGGFAALAAQESVNLARQVADGEQLVVLSEEEILGDSPGGGLISLNRATLEQLDTLPGVGPALAGRILEFRKQNGSFSSLDQLQQVSGIGPKVFAQISTLLTL